MDVPNVFRTEYQLVNIDDGFLNLMNNDGVSKDDVKVPEAEIGDEITAVRPFLSPILSNVPILYPGFRGWQGLPRHHRLCHG